MPKKLLDILKTQPKKSTFLPNQSGYTPHKPNAFTKDFLKKHPVQDPGEPYDNNFLGGVKEFKREKNRFGHSNYDIEKDIDNSQERAYWPGENRVPGASPKQGDGQLEQDTDTVEGTEVLQTFAELLDECPEYDAELIFEAVCNEYQLDELSKKTLGNYINEAHTQNQARQAMVYHWETSQRLKKHGRRDTKEQKAKVAHLMKRHSQAWKAASDVYDARARSDGRKLRGEE